MKKLLLPLFFALALRTALGQAGFSAGNIGISINGGGIGWYPLISETNNGPGLFANTNFGTFNPSLGQTLTLSGAEAIVFKNFSGGTDISSVTLDYRIYATGTPAGSLPAFSTAPRNFTLQSGVGSGSVTDGNGNSYTPGTGYQNQKWANNPTGSPIPLNLLQGLSNGTYTLEVYFQAGTNSVNTGNPIFLNNGGSNFKATFTVVPEPSSLALSLIGGPMILGAWFYLRRSRA